MFYKQLTTIFLILIVSLSTLHAQQTSAPALAAGDISDAELKRFSQAAGEIVAVQRQSQQKMQQAIVNNGIELQRYQQVVQAQQQGQQPQLTQEEQQAFSNIQQDITTIRQNDQSTIMGIFENYSFTESRFRQINETLRADTNLQQRFKAMQQQQQQGAE